MNRCVWILSAVAVLALFGVSVWRQLRRGPMLPYQDSFAGRKADEWTPIGGIWQLQGGAILNRSDERGAKLLTGSAYWTNYQMTADLKMIGHEGDVGVIVRASEAERGIDSYNGYYVGLRSADSALVIGRADHGWMEGRPVPMNGGVHIGEWYRLHVVAVGCNIGAEAVNLSTGQRSWAAFTEANCVLHGKIGLRSMNTGGAWKNIGVSPAGYAAYQSIRSHANFVEQPAYPMREADYNHMREMYFRSTYTAVYRYGRANGMEAGARGPVPVAKITPIADARSNESNGQEIMLRGVVTLTAPLYVQDSSGGIGVDLNRATDLNLGDEIELTGHMTGSGITARFVADSGSLLWNRTSAVPVSVSSTQAASGVFDSALVEVRGTLETKSLDRNGTIHLWLSDTAQSFEAVDPGEISSKAYKSWEPGSELRIRGICTVSPLSDQRGPAFTVLLRSSDDVAVISGPPWWTGWRVAWLILLVLVLIGLAVYLYLRLERWKTRAIIDERERLAHEMHDTLAQNFAGVGFHLQGVRNSFRSGALSRETMMEKLDVACSLVTETHRDASASIAALHPDYNEGLDLLAVLERCACSMLEGDVLPIHLIREGTPRALSTAVRDALYQVGREAMTNVLRHSHATAMTLRLRHEAHSVVLQVTDNGVGFEYDRATKDFGIRTMHRRCEKVRAELKIITWLGEGTILTMRAPYGLRLTLGDWFRSRRLRLRAGQAA